MATPQPTVLRYPGGKTRAIAILAQCLPPDTAFLCSPFLGGGSFELFVATTLGLHVMASDLYWPVHNFWRALILDKGAVCAELSHLYHSEWVPSADGRGTFHAWRDELRGLGDQIAAARLQRVATSPRLSPAERRAAAVYYAVNHLSFNGGMTGGFSANAARKGLTTRALDRLARTNVANFRPSALPTDFEQTLRVASARPDARAAVFFLDPPYCLARNDLYGDTGELHRHFDHQRLFRALRTLAAQGYSWLCCYNNCAPIRALYAAFPMQETRWAYGGPRDRELARTNNELIIFSPALHRRLTASRALARTHD